MPVEDVDFPEDVHTVPPVATATPARGPSGDDDPDLDQEPHRGTGEEASDTEETEPKVAEFDPRVRQEFDGLLYLGRLTDTFEVYGHQITIRTLSTGELMEIGLIHKPYVGTISDVKAYQAAMVAACVVSVDGKPMPLPITTEPFDTSLLNKFQYVQRSWFPPLLDLIYERYMELEQRVDKVLAAMGNQSR